MVRMGLALLVISALFAPPSSAQSLTGTWELRTEGGRGGFLAQSLTLTQDGNTLTGIIAVTGGGLPPGVAGRAGGSGSGRAGTALAGTIGITEGTVEGNTFRFTAVIEFNGNSITQTYSGTFEGDTMSGTMEGARAGARPFTGTRGG